MKRLVLALALAPGAIAALAQAPDAPAIPAAKCGAAPAYPGIKALGDDRAREAFQGEIKNYQDCVKAYVAERKAFIDASNAAIRAIVDEHNAAMGRIRAEQEAAVKALEKK